MPSRRLEKVNDQIRAEISDLILRHMKDPRVHGLVSVTEVDTSPDLRRARVFISIFGSDEERKETMATLHRAAGYLRHELGERLRMKRAPDLDLRLDLSMERGDRIMRLLREVQDGPGGADEGVASPAPSSQTEGMP